MLGNSESSLPAAGRKNASGVLGTLQNPKKKKIIITKIITHFQIKIQKKHFKRLFNRINKQKLVLIINDNGILNIYHRMLRDEYGQLTLLIMFNVHSKTASNICGISPVMCPPSLFTIVAMVLSTSGSLAAGTLRW